jgi:hypothetical protein
MNIFQNDHRLSVGTRLAKASPVKAELPKAREAQAAFQTIFDTWSPLLDPRKVLDGFVQVIDQAATPEEIVQAQLAANRMQDRLTEQGIARTRRAIRDAHREFADALKPLLAAATQELDALRQEAIEAESVFFAEWGLTRNPTAVTARLDQAASFLEQASKSLEVYAPRPGPQPGSFLAMPESLPGRNAFGSIIAWFEAQK